MLTRGRVWAQESLDTTPGLAYPSGPNQTQFEQAEETMRIDHWLRTGRLPRAIGLGIVFVGVFVDWFYWQAVERRHGGNQ
jgi:hypothetical protein